jgi:aryl-alcohol dehydrogenase-like predicted oxidoreductase
MTALAWVMSRPTVTSVLVGARSPEELSSWNLSAVDLSLLEAVIRQLDDVTKEIKVRLGLNPDSWFTPRRIR